jgi:hypothetical protein
MRINMLGILLVSFLFLYNSQAIAQDDGKLGGFEDAVKGEKSNESEDGDEDDGGGFLGFLFEIGIDFFFNNDSHHSYTEEEEEEEEGLRFGAYPFDSIGMVNQNYHGKNYLGRISGGVQHIDARINAFKLNARIQFNGQYGLELDYSDFTERRARSTDHLQIIGVNYRNLLIAENNLLLAGNIGLTIINPDNFKDTDYGLNIAADLQWFFADQLSLNAKLGYAPILQYLHYAEPPGLWDMEIGTGVHLKNIEFFASYKTLIPTFNTSSALFGPELGIRFWF